MTDKADKRPVDADHLGNSFSPDLLGRRSFAVFDVDAHWCRSKSPLPSILVTEQTIESLEIENSEELYTTPHGARYPILRFPDESPSPLEHFAWSFGYNYYYEGISTSAKENLGKRIDCFRAAELLYLHAAARGDIRSHSGLGKIYANDYAEGHYFDAIKNNLFANLVLPKEEIRAKAYQHMSYAAAHDDIEGSYLLGDLLREGIGCDVDMDAAFQSYQKAWQLTQRMMRPSEAFLGSSAWRIARAYEEGEGCPCDYDAALQWYETANLNLEISVDSGAWYLDIERAGAKRGLLRMRQEIALSKRGVSPFVP